MSHPEIRLIVSIDTEEDNWVPARSGITTTNIRELPSLERRFEALGVRATYFTNYQVLLEPSARAVIREIHDGGRAEIGSHLHPWNTPPLLPKMETMLLRVPRELQQEKIHAVTTKLTELLGTEPRAFRAGRFGLGPQTVEALVSEGYAIDSSVTPFFSWENHDRGPSYIGAPLQMYRISGKNDVRVPDGGPLLEVPVSAGYNRWHPRLWSSVQAMLNGAMAQTLRLHSAASRSGIARPVIMSPEPQTEDELYGLASALIRGGLPFLHVFWHSPSMTPGLTPFCRSRSEVDRMWRRFERLIDRLGRRAQLRFATISEAASQVSLRSE